MKSIICIYQEPCLVSHHWPSCVCSLLTSLASLVSSMICPWPDVWRCDGCCPWEWGSHTSEECWLSWGQWGSGYQSASTPAGPAQPRPGGWVRTQWLRYQPYNTWWCSLLPLLSSSPLLPSPGQQLYNNQWSFYWCFTFIFIMVVFSKVLIVI